MRTLKTSTDRDRRTGTATGRQPYERPAIVSRERLEVIAAVCSPGKASGQPGDCFLNTNS